MLTLTPEQFAAKLNQNADAIRKLIDNDLPRIIGVEAVKHFKMNFQNEAWERQPWPEVKRRMKPVLGKKGHALKNQPAWARRKILTGKTDKDFYNILFKKN